MDLNEPSFGACAIRTVVTEAEHRCQRATWGDFEYRSSAIAKGIEVGPTSGRCPVEFAVGSLDQRSVGVLALRAMNAALGAEAVYRRERAARGNNEDRSTAVGPAIHGCPVKVAIGGLDQRVGVCAVAALGAEAVKRNRRAAGGYSEDGTGAAGSACVSFTEAASKPSRRLSLYISDPCISSIRFRCASGI